MTSWSRYRPLCCLVLSSTPLAAPLAAQEKPSDPALHPPIPIRFTLKEPGVVTLVVEDAGGKRVRNLIAETPFPAGENVVWWDGRDESGRINESHNGVYEVQGKLVAPGSYRARGIVRKPIDLRYEFTVYNEAQIPWETADRSSQWLTNHTPPSAILFLPPGAAPERSLKSPDGQLLVGSRVAEGGHGLAWIDARDGRKLHGQMWVGGVWTGATHLARDVGDDPVPGVYAYTGAAWQGDGWNGKKPELRLHELVTPDQKRKNSGAWVKGTWDPNAASDPSDNRMGTGEDRRVLQENYPIPNLAHEEERGLSGLAARNGILVASLPTLNRLLFVDARAHKILGEAEIESPQGVAFQPEGGLLVLSGKRLLRFPLAAAPPVSEGKIVLPAPRVLVASGLEEPKGIALDGAGNIYVTDWGKSHNVKVFSAEGKPLRTIGRPGMPKAGPYDPQRMNHPYGLTVAYTPAGPRLWVAEEDFLPKCLSVWTLDGKFVRAYYGPTIYGGGGALDPGDRTRFFHDGIEFALDWKTGKSQPVSIYYRPEKGALTLPGRMFDKRPETPLRARGFVYVTDAYTGSPTHTIDVAGLYRMQNGVARLVAAAGAADRWSAFEGLVRKAAKPGEPAPEDTGPGVALRALLPKDVKPGDRIKFVWSDLDENGKVDTAEVQFGTGWQRGAGVMVGGDLAFTLPDSTRLVPVAFTKTGVPRYDLSSASRRFGWYYWPTSGGGHILDQPDGWSVATAGPFQGFRTGPGNRDAAEAPTWTYPNQWPGLHASHFAPIAREPGEVVGATRPLGPPISLPSADPSDKTPFVLWGMNGNKGTGYVFTSDGLFVATLFKDHRVARAWPEKAERNMPLNDVSMNEESFYNTMTQAADGTVYVQTTNHIVRVDGLDSLRRLPAQEVDVTPELLRQAQDYFVQKEAARRAAQGTGTISVPLKAEAPTVDGKLDEWDEKSFVAIDVKTRAAAAISGDTLYLAYKTGYRDLLRNQAESLPLLFKTGGALDLMIAADPGAAADRKEPAAGDQRLLVTRVSGQTVAMRYRPKAGAGETAQPVPFASPSRTVTFERVDDVSAQVRLAQGKTPIEEFHKGSFGDRNDRYEGDAYEVAIPLAAIGLKPASGVTLRGDLGILIGNGFQTIQRVYWHNKATSVVSDIPTEAMLTPQLWGKWEVK